MRNLKLLRTWAVTVTVLLAVISISMAAVQQAPRRNAERRPGQQDVEGLMNAYIISKLQDALQPSDDQFAEMVLLQKRIGENRRNYRSERRRTLEQIRQALREPAGEEQLAPLLKKLEDLQTQFEAERRTDYEAIDNALDVRQRTLCFHPVGR